MAGLPVQYKLYRSKVYLCDAEIQRKGISGILSHVGNLGQYCEFSRTTRSSSTFEYVHAYLYLSTTTLTAYRSI